MAENSQLLLESARSPHDPLILDQFKVPADYEKVDDEFFHFPRRGMASEPKKKIVDKKKKISAKKKLDKEKEKEKSAEKNDATIEEKQPTEPPTTKSPVANIIDGRVFEADRELALSQEEEEAMIKFREDLEKYHKISRKEREDSLKEEKKQLIEQEKSPRIKYYDGTKAERIKQVDLEIEILAQMEKLATSKENDD